MIRRQLHHQQSPSPPSCSVQTAPSSQTSLSSNCICFYNLREGLLNLVCLRDFLILASFLYSLSLMHLLPGGNSSTWRKQQASRQVSATEHRSPSQGHQRPCSKAGPCDGNSRECPTPRSLPFPTLSHQHFLLAFLRDILPVTGECNSPFGSTQGLCSNHSVPVTEKPNPLSPSND